MSAWRCNVCDRYYLASERRKHGQWHVDRGEPDPAYEKLTRVDSQPWWVNVLILVGVMAAWALALALFGSGVVCSLMPGGQC